MDERPIIIRTYKRVWKLDRFLYRIDKYKLPFPVTYWQILYFFLGFFLAGFLNRWFFLFTMLPAIAKFLLFPIAFAWYLSKAKHDGKAPHRWLWTYIRYLLYPKVFNRHRPVRLAAKERYVGVCTFRELYQIEGDT